MLARTLVIPAYNEENRLATAFERLRPALERLGPEETEIVMVDDGSSDDTMRVAHRVYGHLENFRLVQHPHNMGKGAAVRTGLAHARSPKVVVSDADMSIRPEHFVEILAALDGADVAPGSRAVDGRIRYDHPVRSLSGVAFHALVRHYTRTRVRDTQCGCKGFRLGPGRTLATLGLITGFAYDVEMFYLADQLGLAVESVPVTWDDIGGSTVHFANAHARLLHDLRDIPRTHYQCPAVSLGPDVDLGGVRRAALTTRSAGLVLARGPSDALLLVHRDGAVNAIGLAEELGGELRTADVATLVGRRLEAI